MQTVSYSEARASLATLLDRVTDDQEPVIISRRGKQPVALVALAELESYRETAHLLRSPRNAERLLAALKRAKQGEGLALTVEQLQHQVGYHEPEAPRR